MVGPFHPFTSIFDLNGAGRLNLMDAISFILLLVPCPRGHFSDLIAEKIVFIGAKLLEK